MTAHLQEIINLANRYGLKISSIDATDVTLITRLEVVPQIHIQVYRNVRKDKLSLALILGNSRIYGFDREGGTTHRHPIENPEAHIPCTRRPAVEEFILECLKLLADRGLI